MHTETFRRLQDKLNLPGRQYLEGFSANDFVGLTSDERSDVCHTLKTRSLLGDGVSLDALVHILRAEDFLAFAESLLFARNSLDLFSAQLAITIFDRTVGGCAWDKIVDLLKSGDTSARRWILNKLAVSVISGEQIDQLAVVLADLVKEEMDTALLNSEVGMLLVVKGFTPKSTEFIQHAQRLRTLDKGARKTALVEIGCVST